MPKQEKFLVHPDSLRAFAALLERNRGYLGDMQTHNGFTAETKGLQGIMIRWAHACEDLSRWQNAKLSDMVAKLGATIHGLQETANTYVNTDTASAEEFDKKLPSAPDNGSGPGRGAI